MAIEITACTSGNDSNQFIMVHRNNDEIYVSASHIVGIIPYQDGAEIHMDTYGNTYGYLFYRVKETPEEVLELIARTK